jgi:fatty acid desaturase
MTANESALFVRETHHLVRDLLTPNPRRYWIDFVATMLLADTTLFVYLVAAPFSLLQALALVTCGLAMYRAAVFTHEIAHRRAGSLTGFAAGWNILFGIPFFMPSFLYGDHQSHHSNQGYGTWADPEYLMRGSHGAARVCAFLLLPIFYPALAVIRFLFLTPLSLVSTRADRVVWTSASSLYLMNESYRREYDTSAQARSRWLQEIACACWAWTLVLLAFSDRLPLSMLGKTYLVFVFWIALNQLRTLAAHGYSHGTPTPISYVDQLLDTNTFARGRWLPDLWAPLGLRYHALHHLIPTLPYHAMREAHRRLMERLPAGSPYHRTIKPGLWPVVIAIFGQPQRRVEA